MINKNIIREFLNGEIQYKQFDKYYADLARNRQDNLTKPMGSLGKLEKYAIWMAGWQKKEKPTINNFQCLVFAGNHGVAKKNVSAYPPEVTEQMVKNFKNGGAAINQLCKLSNIKLSVIPINLEKPTKDFSEEKAMNLNETFSAMKLGYNSVPKKCDLLLLGEMGISNTTSATAIACALFNSSVKKWTGLGTGVSEWNLKNKISVIQKGLRLHGKKFHSVVEILSCFGGREMAAIVGSVIAARVRGIPILLDGFVSTASAATLTIFNKNILEHCLISHLSSEPGHKGIILKLKKEPILDLNMRLGEASGGAVASLIIKAALVTHNKMTTFSEAGVTKKN
tara:strand:- start:1628 stop:2644 length:1017 start_codon:yes stop_codon:yes gene_type:complete